MDADLGTRKFVAGDTYTLADVLATCFLCSIHMIKGTKMMGLNTLNYFNQMKQRPSFESAKCIMNFD
jgi:glutathione S-transferase